MNMNIHSNLEIEVANQQFGVELGMVMLNQLPQYD